MNHELFKLEDVEARYGILAGTIRQKINRKEITGVKVPKKPGGTFKVWAITQDTIDYLLKQQDPDSGSYDQLYREWIDTQASGYLTGKRISKKGIEANKYGLQKFWYFLSFIPDYHDPVDYHRFSEIAPRRFDYSETFKAPRKILKKPSVAEVTPENLRLALSRVRTDHKKENCHFTIRDQMYKGIRSFYKLLIQKGLRNRADMLVFDEIRPKREYAVKTKVVYNDGYEKLLSENRSLSSGRSKTGFDQALTETIFVLLFNTGMRQSELINLKLSDINWERLEFDVLGKGGKRRVLGISEEVEAQIRYWIEKHRPQSEHDNLLLQKNGLPTTKNVIYRRIYRLGKRASLEVHTHAFRHGFATELAEEGASTYELQGAMGHSSSKVTDGYVTMRNFKVTQLMRSRKRLRLKERLRGKPNDRAAAFTEMLEKMESL